MKNGNKFSCQVKKPNHQNSIINLSWWVRHIVDQDNMKKGETVRTKNYKENVNAISRLFLEVNWMPQVSSIYACNISFGKSVRTCNWRNNFFKLSFFFSSTEMWNSSQSNNLFRALVPLANLLAMDISIYLMGEATKYLQQETKRENKGGNYIFYEYRQEYLLQGYLLWISISVGKWYSWTRPQSTYTEELISRPLVGESRFQSVFQNRVGTKNAVGSSCFSL